MLSLITILYAITLGIRLLTGGTSYPRSIGQWMQATISGKYRAYLGLVLMKIMSCIYLGGLNECTSLRGANEPDPC